MRSPNKIIVLDESDGEIEVTGMRPLKRAKIAMDVASPCLVPDLNNPVCWDLTNPTTAFDSSHGMLSSLPSPSCGVQQQAIFGSKWSFSALNRSPQTSSDSISRSSSATFDNSPSPTVAPAIVTLDLTNNDLTSTAVIPAIVTLDLTSNEDDDDFFFVGENITTQGTNGVPENVIDIEDFVHFEFEGPQIYEVDSDSELEPAKVQRCKVIPRRNPRLVSDLRVLCDITHHDTILSSGMVVEVLEAGMGVDDSWFLSIVKIISNESTGEVTLRGHRLQRTKDGNGILEKKLNEVYMCHEVDLDDPRETDEQSVIEVPLHNVVRERKLRYTNRNFPRARYIQNSFGEDEKEQLYVEGGLTLRWVYTCFFLTATHRHKNKYGERVLERVRLDESSPHGVSEALLKDRWRGSTIAGGAFLPGASTSIDSRRHQRNLPFLRTSKRTRQETEECVEGTRRRFDVIDLSNDAPIGRKSSSLPRALSIPLDSNVGELVNVNSSMQPRGVRVPGQKYTFGDAFCGAGGTTRGAEMAGLKVIWGFDFDQTACTTWRQNFDADCYQMEAFRFADIFKNTDAAKVDILHLSPPCQYFAPCHTRPGPNDEANSAALFAVQEIMAIAKPRIVTLEQTLGLGRQQQHQGYLNSLIQMFTRAGFSVRWEIRFLAPWGLPARRQRLIIIASCPGEVLPRMPLPTHSENGADGLKPFVTVNQAINTLHPSTNLDADIKYFNEVQLQHPKIHPYNGNKILPKAITCSGGDFNYHPSGQRGLTLREFAALQGFPPIHTFSGMSSQGTRLKGSTIVRKQIGNAVPPVVARTLFESIIKDLQKADGIESEHILIE